MSKIFVTADSHWGHANIIKYCKRPFDSPADMDEYLIKKWNETVGKDDKVFHLGDFAFGDQAYTKSIVSQLNGNIHLLLGNHDKHPPKWYMERGFREVSSYPIIWSEFVVMSHQPPQFISDDTPYIFLYGHVHGSEMYQTITKRSACVCVERWDYAPIDIDTILKKQEKL
jgi:calcineurin-like phosphoesterase family protein